MRSKRKRQERVSSDLGEGASLEAAPLTEAQIRALGVKKFGGLAKNWKIETIKKKLAA